MCVGGIPLLSIQISKRLTIKFFRLVFFFGFFFWSVLYVKESELSLQKGKLSLAADRGWQIGVDMGRVGSPVPVPTRQHLPATGSAKPSGELVPTKYVGTDSPGRVLAKGHWWTETNRHRQLKSNSNDLWRGCWRACATLPANSWVRSEFWNMPGDYTHWASWGPLPPSIEELDFKHFSDCFYSL